MDFISICVNFNVGYYGIITVRKQNKNTTIFYRELTVVRLRSKRKIHSESNVSSILRNMCLRKIQNRT